MEMRGCTKIGFLCKTLLQSNLTISTIVAIILTPGYSRNEESMKSIQWATLIA